jgi:hypothetical protein
MEIEVLSLKKNLIKDYIVWRIKTNKKYLSISATNLFPLIKKMARPSGFL